MEGRIGVKMRWRGEECFDVEAGDHTVVLDGESELGLSPMQYLATGVTGCMAIDIAHILGRMRTAPDSLTVTMDTERPEDPPRRFTGLKMHVRAVGDIPQANLDRAIGLSRDKYCSALHTLKDDIELTVSTEILPSG
jgi:putative redox protein